MAFPISNLKKYGFGEYFSNWIKILYTDIKTCVGNNGYFSPYFKLSRSIRQGCPISALLFLLVAEILAIQIRSDKTIKGIRIIDEEIKIGLMADDTTLFLADLNSLNVAINLFKDFEKNSGLKLNLDKTEIIPIGRNKNKIIILPPNLSTIKINNGPFKALGIWYSDNQKEILELNVEKRIKNMNTIINIWKSRNLSLKGRITILKTLIAPQINFLFSMIYIPEQVLKKIDKILFDYLWNSKPAKIKRSTIIAPINEGGMGMIDIYYAHQASKISWIKRLYDSSTAKWKTIMLKTMQTDLQKLNRKYIYNISKIPHFYQQVIEAWKQVSNFKPTDYLEVINEYIMYNDEIKIGNKILDEKFVSSENARNLKIIDILDDDQRFKTPIQLKTNYNITQMKYNSMISAIPSIWKKQIKEAANNQDGEITRIPDEPHIKINNNLKPLAKCTNKNIYYNLMQKYIKPPTSIEKWVIIFPFLEKEDWSQIFKRAFEITKEPYLQSFQYKILNRILNNRDNLFKWKISQSNICNSCKEVDGVEHHLFYCVDSKLFWKRVKEWMIGNLGFGFELTVCEVLFGIPNSNNADTKLLNFLILMGKWFINNCKVKEKPIYFIEYLSIIKDKVEAMINSKITQGMIPDQWLETLHEVQ